jgi:hypothetical protein
LVEGLNFFFSFGCSSRWLADARVWFSEGLGLKGRLAERWCWWGREGDDHSLTGEERRSVIDRWVFARSIFRDMDSRTDTQFHGTTRCGNGFGV